MVSANNIFQMKIKERNKKNTVTLHKMEPCILNLLSVHTLRVYLVLHSYACQYYLSGHLHGLDSLRTVFELPGGAVSIVRVHSLRFEDEAVKRR